MGRAQRALLAVAVGWPAARGKAASVLLFGGSRGKFRWREPPMLSAEDNRVLTQRGAGTLMGELLRRFWLPVLLSGELPEPDGPPKKIVVMGEPLLGLRDTRGRVGIVDQHCPHRGANLWLERNEECGIRCVYHGWKFAVEGRCLDMPTSYPDLNAKDKMAIKAYPRASTGEWSGPIWDRASACRICRQWKWPSCQPRIGMSPRNGRTATGYRPWRGASGASIRHTSLLPIWLSTNGRMRTSTFANTSRALCHA